MGELTGKMKNQVTKNTFTIVVFLNLDSAEYEVTRHRVQADGVKEAVEKFNQIINRK
jgi:hypothetical protein